jgi:hypothetical protein
MAFKNAKALLKVALIHYSQVHSSLFLPHPLQTPFLIGLPHFSQGEHPQV